MITPSLELNFTTASLDSRVTFTRTTGASKPATYVNSSGVVTAATNNEPRFDYDPATLVCKGLLIEESRTNLLLQSSNFATTWTATRSSVSSLNVIAPDNSETVYKLICDSTLANNHYVNQAGLTSVASAYSFTIFVKASEITQIRMGASSSAPWGGTAPRAYFNLTTQAITNVTATVASSSITSYPNGWYKCTFSTTTASSGSTLGIQIDLAVNGAVSFNGDGVSGCYIWGAQLEVGAFPTSYIPTTTAALTRNSDVATITGANFSSFWQAVKGGTSVLATPSTVSGIRPLVQFDDATANNIIALRDNTTNPELYIVDGGTPQAQIDAGTIAANTSYNLTGWWQTNFCAARKDNGARVEDLTATIPTVTQARLGSDGTNYLNGHLATINYYDQFLGQIYTRRKNKAVFTVI